jgi:thiol-disulfide isomerase/thioredoxin
MRPARRRYHAVMHPRGLSLLERPLARAAVAVALLAAAGAGIALLLVRDGGDDEALGGSSGYGGPVYVVCEVAGGNGPVIGEPAPAFSLCDDGGDVAFETRDPGAPVTFINFWATWCVPCRRELPDIQKVYDEKRDSGLQVFAINHAEDRETAIAFLNSRGVTLPLVLDPEGRLYDAFRLQGLPDSFFIGDDGTLRTLQYGFLTEDKMRERIEQAGLP